MQHGLSGLGLLNPVVHFCVELIQRQRTVAKNFIMKGAQVEIAAKLQTGFIAQLQNFQLA